MPYATRRAATALNKAYASLTSRHFKDAVEGLVDKLVEMGFDESEVAENIETVQPELADGFFGRHRRQMPSVAVDLDAPVEALKGIEQAAPGKLSVGPNDQGRTTLTVKGFLKPAEKERVLAQMPARFHGQFQEAMTAYEIDNRHLASPAQRGEDFVAPRLFATVQGELVLADTDLLFEYHDWTLKDHPHQLTEQEFSIRQVADAFEIDIDGGRLFVQHSDQSEQLLMDIGVDGWTEQGLVLWLDRKVRNPAIGQGELIAWLSAVVGHLIHQRGIPLSALMRCQFLLAL
jgi:type III restriction enzyme